jgi:hypothetical protein
MKLFPDGKSKVLSGAALSAAVLCAIMSFKSASSMVTLLDMVSTPALSLGLLHATLPSQMPPLASLLVRNVGLFFSFMLLLWLSGLILSLAVLARKEWGRQGAVWMLYLLSSAALLMLIYPWLAVPRPIMYQGISVAPEFNAAVRSAAFFARLTAFLGGGSCLWGALALDRGELKKEFRL